MECFAGKRIEYAEVQEEYRRMRICKTEKLVLRLIMKCWVRFLHWTVSVLEEMLKITQFTDGELEQKHQGRSKAPRIGV